MKFTAADLQDKKIEIETKYKNKIVIFIIILQKV